MSQQPRKQYKKPSTYVTFATGNVVLDENTGGIKVIRCNSALKPHEKRNNGQAYAVFVAPVDEDGTPDTSRAMKVESFAVAPTGVDKNQYPNAPDFRAFFGCDEEGLPLS